MALDSMPEDGDLRNVVPLRRPGQAPRLFPDTTSSGEVAGLDHDGDEVLEGEVVEDGEWEDLPALHRAAVIVREAVTSEEARAAARQLSYVVAGASVARRRWKDTRGTGRHERMMLAAEAAGDHEAVMKWAELAAQTIADRHARRMDRAASITRHMERLPLYAKASAGTLGGIGVLLAIAQKDPALVVEPFLTLADVVQWAIHLVAILWGPVLVSAPLVALLALWAYGRRNIEASDIQWVKALTPGEGSGEIIVTADGIIQALQHLRIPEMKKAFKDGWIPKFYTTPVRDGRGYHAVVELPLGVTAEMVADLRPVLARNLHRAEIEVWPSDAEKARTGPAGALDVWIADSGALSQHAPEYPLLHEGTADVFAGVPAGVSPRGDVITVPIVGKNVVAGGQMGQGKSNACRVILLGCALDPLCVIDAFVFANNGDFDAYAPRLANYVKGTEDDTAYAAVERLRWLYDEVGRREDRLSELGAKKVTRALAAKHPDLRPIVSLFSECHELFGHPEYGEEAAELAIKTAKRARKTGIVEIFDTQSARKGAIPPALVELVAVNVCFYVKSWRNNDGFLGDGCFQAGIRATELRPDRDVGTSLITGVSGSPFELLKWHFVPVDDDTGWDAATEVIARAMEAVDPRTPTKESAAAREIEQPRNLLDDLDEVLGAERVKLSDVPALLRELAPRWRPYRSLTAKTLRAELEAAGVRVTNPKNILHLDPADLRARIAELSTEDLDHWG